MKALSTNILRRQPPQKRCSRRSSIATALLSGLLATSIFSLPISRALADERVLELPQAVSIPHDDAALEPLAEPAPPAERHHRGADARLAGVGSIQDYEHQDESPYRWGVLNTSSGSGARVDPNGNRDALVQDVILGAVAIGLFAMEVHAAHHQHRR